MADILKLKRSLPLSISHTIMQAHTDRHKLKGNHVTKHKNVPPAEVGSSPSAAVETQRRKRGRRGREKNDISFITTMSQYSVPQLPVPLLI